MKHFTAKTAAPDVIVDELLNGGGAVKVSGLFSKDQIAQAGAIVMQHSEQDSASPEIRQLIGLNYPYPEVLDAAQAGNTEGRK